MHANQFWWAWFFQFRGFYSLLSSFQLASWTMINLDFTSKCIIMFHHKDKEREEVIIRRPYTILIKSVLFVSYLVEDSTSQILRVVS